MEIGLLQYLFDLKPLIEFHSAFFQSNNCFRVRRILTLLYLEAVKRRFPVYETADHDALLGFLFLIK